MLRQPIGLLSMTETRDMRNISKEYKTLSLRHVLSRHAEGTTPVIQSVFPTFHFIISQNL